MIRSFFWADHPCGHEARLKLDLNPHPLKCTKGAAPGCMNSCGWGRRFGMRGVWSKPRGLGDRGYRVDHSCSCVWAEMFAGMANTARNGCATKPLVPQPWCHNF